MAGYIPKEHLNAYQRWQVDSFDPPPPEPPPLPLDAGPENIDESSEVVTDFGLPTAEDIERIHNEAYSSGYQAGYDEGREAGYRAGLEAAEAEGRRISSLADNVEKALGTIDQAVADQVLALALEVANQVLRGALAVQPEALIPVIREALAALPLHHGHVALHVNPEDAEMVRQQLGDHFLQAGWRVVEDRDIQAGGCFLRAGSSEVDATLETRWKRVLEAIGVHGASWLERS